MADRDHAIAPDPKLTTTHWNGLPSHETSAPTPPSVRYEKQVALGEGPHRRVWRAYDHDLRRVVAIKILGRERMHESSGFLAGARNIASIRHPGIVQVHDILEEKDGISIISDYVEGDDLSQRLRRGPIATNDILEWGVQIAEALAFIHSKGIVHADVTPANILLSDHGQALLCNFCSARSTTDAAEPSTKTAKTPYMAPELFLGKPLATGCDVFSLGTILIEALHSGSQRPSKEPRESTIPLQTQLAKIPSKFRHLLAKCVSPNPSERPSAQGLAIDLRKIKDGKSRLPLWVAALIVAVISACALGSWLLPAADHGREIAWEARAQSLIEDLSNRLMLLNPDFDGTITPLIENGMIRGLELSTEKISDLTPIASLRDLNYFKASAIDGGGQVSDLTPIKGLRIKRLQLNGNARLEKLEPLEGMPLEHLNIEATGVSDLASLAGAPLNTLNCSKTRVKSLAPLANAPLATLWINDTKVANLEGMTGMRLSNLRASRSRLQDLAPLNGMPLQIVECNHTPIQSIEPLRGMKTLSVVSVVGTKVTDLSPLLTLPGLKFLFCEIDWKRDEQVLRQLNRLEMINDSSHADLVWWYSD